MYMDFALMASDQIANQAAKWHYMSGGSRGAARHPRLGRRRQGLRRAAQPVAREPVHAPARAVRRLPLNPADAKGLLKSAIRDNNPVLFVESQGLYGTTGPVPEGDVLVPIGRAAVAREGRDATIVAWGPAVPDALAAADRLATDEGLSVEVVDLRSLVPLDMETVLASVRKTGRCVVASQAVLIGSFVNEVIARIQAEAFDDLDAPVGRVGAANGISPQATGLEAAFLPTADDLVQAVVELG